MDRPNYLSRDTTRIVDQIERCRRLSGRADHGGYCPCIVDSMAARLVDSQEDVTALDAQRCRILDRYLEATQSFLTVRQFEGLDGAPRG